MLEVFSFIIQVKLKYFICHWRTTNKSQWGTVHYR